MTHRHTGTSRESAIAPFADVQIEANRAQLKVILQQLSEHAFSAETYPNSISVPLNRILQSIDNLRAVNQALKEITKTDSFLYRWLTDDKPSLREKARHTYVTAADRLYAILQTDAGRTASTRVKRAIAVAAQTCAGFADIGSTSSSTTTQTESVSEGDVAPGMATSDIDQESEGTAVVDYTKLSFSDTLAPKGRGERLKHENAFTVLKNLLRRNIADLSIEAIGELIVSCNEALVAIESNPIPANHNIIAQIIERDRSYIALRRDQLIDRKAILEFKQIYQFDELIRQHEHVDENTSPANLVIALQRVKPALEALKGADELKKIAQGGHRTLPNELGTYQSKLEVIVDKLEKLQQLHKLKATQDFDQLAVQLGDVNDEISEDDLKVLIAKADAAQVAITSADIPSEWSNRQAEFAGYTTRITTAREKADQILEIYTLIESIKADQLLENLAKIGEYHTRAEIASGIDRATQALDSVVQHTDSINIWANLKIIIEGITSEIKDELTRLNALLSRTNPDDPNSVPEAVSIAVQSSNGITAQAEMRTAADSLAGLPPEERRQALQQLQGAVETGDPTRIAHPALQELVSSAAIAAIAESLAPLMGLDVPVISKIDTEPRAGVVGNIGVANAKRLEIAGLIISWLGVTALVSLGESQAAAYLGSEQPSAVATLTSSPIMAGILMYTIYYYRELGVHKAETTDYHRHALARAVVDAYKSNPIAGTLALTVFMTSLTAEFGGVGASMAHGEALGAYGDQVLQLAPEIRQLAETQATSFAQDIENLDTNFNEQILAERSTGVGPLSVYKQTLWYGTKTFTIKITTTKNGVTETKEITINPQELDKSFRENADQKKVADRLIQQALEIRRNLGIRDNQSIAEHLTETNHDALERAREVAEAFEQLQPVVEAQKAIPTHQYVWHDVFGRLVEQAIALASSHDNQEPAASSDTTDSPAGREGDADTGSGPNDESIKLPEGGVVPAVKALYAAIAESDEAIHGTNPTHPGAILKANDLIQKLQAALSNEGASATPLPTVMQRAQNGVVSTANAVTKMGELVAKVPPPEAPLIPNPHRDFQRLPILLTIVAGFAVADTNAWPFRVGYEARRRKHLLRELNQRQQQCAEFELELATRICQIVGKEIGGYAAILFGQDALHGLGTMREYVLAKLDEFAHEGVTEAVPSNELGLVGCAEYMNKTKIAFYEKIASDLKARGPEALLPIIDKIAPGYSKTRELAQAACDPSRSEDYRQRLTEDFWQTAGRLAKEGRLELLKGRAEFLRKRVLAARHALELRHQLGSSGRVGNISPESYLQQGVEFDLSRGSAALTETELRQATTWATLRQRFEAESKELQQICLAGLKLGTELDVGDGALAQFVAELDQDAYGMTTESGVFAAYTQEIERISGLSVDIRSFGHIMTRINQEVVTPFNETMNRWKVYLDKIKGEYTVKLSLTYSQKAGGLTVRASILRGDNGQETVAFEDFNRPLPATEISDDELIAELKAHFVDGDTNGMARLLLNDIRYDQQQRHLEYRQRLTKELPSGFSLLEEYNDSQILLIEEHIASDLLLNRINSRLRSDQQVSEIELAQLSPYGKQVTNQLATKGIFTTVRKILVEKNRSKTRAQYSGRYDPYSDTLIIQKTDIGRQPVEIRIPKIRYTKETAEAQINAM